MQRVCGRRYDTGEPITLSIEAGRIVSVSPFRPTVPLDTVPFVAPGLFDLQINGHGGVWFSDSALTVEQVHRAVQAYVRFGVTQLLPTLVTNSPEALEHGFRTLEAACADDPLTARLVAGYHLEGPFLSPEDGPRGAHPREHIRPPDWELFARLQQAAGGRIRLLTIAPEWEAAPEFIARAVAAGVRIAIGHTGATPAQIHAAVDAGARLSTHLGNGCAAQLHRHHNILWPQLADPRLTACLIADGHHVPADLVRTVLKAKSSRNVILTCDAAGWAGCPPGIYQGAIGASEILESGKLVVAGQRELLAGSAQETDVCLTTIRAMTGVGWREAVDMTSRNPARALGFEPARLRRGAPADLFLFTAAPGAVRPTIVATLLDGVVRHGAVPSCGSPLSVSST